MKYNKSVIAISMIAVNVVFASNIQAASFDCSKAATYVENEVCNNIAFSKMDEILADKYVFLLESINDEKKANLKDLQRKWLLSRNKCKNSECIEIAYRERIDQFCRQLGLVGTDFQCISIARNQGGESLESNNSDRVSPSTYRERANANYGSTSHEASIPVQRSTRVSQANGAAPASSPNRYSVDSPEIRVVVTDGLGTDIPSAAQNAAQNALIQVVGSFMDATKVLEKRVEIQEGVRTQSSKIDTNIKEYSQGSIQGFEVLDVTTQAGLTKVTAKVSVRMEDFKTYIKKSAEGEVTVAGESLFAKAATETKQTANKTAMLYENVILPIASGQALDFTIGPPQPASSLKVNRSVRNNTRVMLDTLIQEHGIENVIVFNLTISLKPEFEENMKKTLSTISSNKKMVISGLSPSGEGRLFAPFGLDNSGGNWPADDLLFAIINYQSAINNKKYFMEGVRFDAYYIQNVKQKLKAIADPSLNISFGGSVSGNFYIPDLEVSLLDENKNSLQSFLFQRVVQKNQVFIDVMGGRGFIAEPPTWADSFFAPWALMWDAKSGVFGWLFSLFDHRDIEIVLAIEPTALAKTKIIRVNLVN